MNQTELNKMNITQTVEGYEVKDLTWIELDKVIRGLVKCPIINSPLHNGFVCVTWRKNGSLMKKHGGNTRPDLYLKLI